MQYLKKEDLPNPPDNSANPWEQLLAQNSKIRGVYQYLLLSSALNLDFGWQKYNDSGLGRHTCAQM